MTQNKSTTTTTQQRVISVCKVCGKQIDMPFHTCNRSLKWWRCKKLPTGRAAKGRGKWEAQRFTFGQRPNMEQYYEVTGPFETKEAAEMAA